MGTVVDDAIANPERVQEMVTDEYLRVGFKTVNRDDETVVDDDAFKARVFELVTSRVVDEPTDKSAHSWTQGELYAAVFPGSPGTDPLTSDQLDITELEVRDVLKRKVWNLTNPARTGYVQKRLVDIAPGSMILCRAKVMRGLDEISGCYITNNPDLIMHDSLAPRIEALVKEADNLRAHAAMITNRHPALEATVAKAIGSGVKRTVAALPKPGSNDSRPSAAIEESS
jgi:hypothetical protein